MVPHRSIFLIFAVMLCGACLLLWACSKSSRVNDLPPAKSPTGKTPGGGRSVKKSNATTGADAKQAAIRFTTMTAENTGVGFVHQSGASPVKPFPSANGSGVAVLDFDLDGRHDLYFGTGTPFPIDGNRQSPVNRVYWNQGGWRFVDVTAETGLGDNGYTAGLTVGDYNGDGFPDVYLACFGRNRLYCNQGDGTFVEVSGPAGADNDKWATSAAFLDYDDDGLLDLYVCNYAIWRFADNRYCGDRERKIRIHCSPKSVKPEPDVLYRNRGDGTFEDATAEAGLSSRRGRAQGVVAADINGDGRIDLYVGNDLHENSLFLNLGGGKFEDATNRAGVGRDGSGGMQAGMGVDAADANRDAQIDLFVTNFAGEHNAFYENGGDGLFFDVSRSYGLHSSSLPWVGWGTMFADFDFDGWQDLVVTNGHVDDNLHLMGKDSPYAQPPLLWRNVKGRFRRAGHSAGSYFGKSHVGRGLVLVDLDEDGDLDVVVTHQDGPPALLRNDRVSVQSNRPCWLRIRLVGTSGNRDAVGASLSLTRDGKPMLRQIKGGGSYLSAHDLRAVFGVDPRQAVHDVDIRWPNGRRTVAKRLHGGQEYLVIEPRKHSSLLPLQRDHLP